MVSISSDDVPIPIVALKTSAVVVPVILRSVTSSPARLSIIAPAVAVSVTVPPASIILNKISVPAVQVTAPAAPAIVWVPLAMVTEVEAEQVISPPADDTLAPWEIERFFDMMEITPAPLSETSADVVTAPSASSVIAVVPLIVWLSASVVSVPVSLASMVILPVPAVLTPFPDTATVILPLSVVRVILPLPDTDVCAILVTLTSPPTPGTISRATTLTKILPLSTLSATRVLIWAHGISTPVAARMVSVAARKRSLLIPSAPVVLLSCLTWPASEYMVMSKGVVLRASLASTVL